MKNVFSWLWSHKALLSYPVGLIGAGLKAKGNPAGDALILIAAWLNGGGHLTSDSDLKQ